MEATGFEQLCVSSLGQVELAAKTAVLYKATWQVRETCRHRGWRAGLALGSICSPKKEGDKYRHKITQTAWENLLQALTSALAHSRLHQPAHSAPAARPACLLPGLPTWKPGDRPTYLLFGAGQKLRPERAVCLSQVSQQVRRRQS